MLSLILIGVFFTVFFFIICIYNTFFSMKINTISRLKEVTASEMRITEDVKEEKKKNLKDLFRLLGTLGKLLPHAKYLSKTKKKLIQASILMKPEEFIGASLISAILIGSLFYLILKSIIVGLIFLIVGFIIPDLILRAKKTKRMAKINSELPEALNIISNGLRAGFSFIQAISVVTNEMEGPIAEEFNKMLKENLLGKSIEEALLNLSDRTDNEDLDIVITALIIQRQVGGNLAEVLDIISETIRDRIKIKGDIKTLTAQGRISGVVISLLPFALGMILSMINPGYIEVLFTTLMGKLMIAVGILLDFIGIFILIKLVDIKV